MRDLRLRELIDTERNYTEALQKVIYNFYFPLKIVLNDEDLSRIFSGFKASMKYVVSQHLLIILILTGLLISLFLHYTNS